MPITTVPIAISTLDITGSPIPGGLVRFQLNAPDAEGVTIVTPVPQVVALDGAGNASVNLWPNVLGTNQTRYDVLIQDRYGFPRLESKAYIPNAAANLVDVLTLAPPATLSDAQVAALAAQAAAAAALAHLAEVQAVVASTPLLVHSYWPGNLAADTELLRTPLACAASFPANFAGSYAIAKIAPSADCVLSIRKNGVEVGTITFLAGQTIGTFASVGGAAVAFVPGDILSIFPALPMDGTIAGVGFGMIGTRS